MGEDTVPAAAGGRQVYVSAAFVNGLDRSTRDCSICEETVVHEDGDRFYLLEDELPDVEGHLQQIAAAVGDREAYDALEEIEAVYGCPMEEIYGAGRLKKNDG
jgi:hypothetical protein